MADILSSGELMDRIYRHQRHIYDLTRKYYLLGRDPLIAALDPPERGTVLEIGCGTGRNLIAAAMAYPKAKFFGIDISSEMLATARENIAGAGLAGRIRVARGDAAGFEPGELLAVRSFDRVFFSYSLSMIPAWREAIRRGVDCLSRDGRMHVVDFGQQEGLPSWFRSLLFAWLRRFHVTPRSDLEAALAAAGEGVGASLVFRPRYRGYAWYAELARGP